MLNSEDSEILWLPPVLLLGNILRSEKSLLLSLFTLKPARSRCGCGKPALMSSR